MRSIGKAATARPMAEFSRAACGGGGDVPPGDTTDDSVGWQLLGALLSAVGVIITVFGLHGLAIYGAEGKVIRCTKLWKWYASVALWGLGQFVQLLAVEFATNSVVAAVANVALYVNAWLARRLYGEPIRGREALALLVMTTGALLVVFTAPPLPEGALTMAQEAALWTASPLPVLGVLATAAATAAAIAVAFWLPSARGAAWGLLAGFAGGSSITAAKFCWLAFNETFRAGSMYNCFADPATYLIGLASAAGECGMAVSLFHGMSRQDSNIVVSTYYISMTVFASLQGLSVFSLFRCFGALDGLGFGAGVALCVAAVAAMTLGHRDAPARARLPSALSGRLPTTTECSPSQTASGSMDGRGLLANGAAYAGE